MKDLNVHLKSHKEVVFTINLYRHECTNSFAHAIAMDVSDGISALVAYL